MRKRITLPAIAVVAAFAVISVVKWRSLETAPKESAREEPERQRVRDFWKAYNQATAMRSQASFSGAAGFYRRALELNPKHEDSLYYLAASLSEVGEYRAAEAALRELLALNPESGRGWAQLGNTLSELVPGAPMDFPAARKAYEQNLRLNPEQAGPFLQLGRLELNRGRFSEAEKRLRTAAAFGSPEAKFLLGHTLLQQNRAEEATELFRKVTDSYFADRKIIAKGVLSEGDVLPEAGKSLTALERAAVTSMLYLYWTRLQTGKSPEQAAAEIHLALKAEHEGFLRRASGAAKASGGRAAWGDFDGDGLLDLVVGGRGSLVLLRNLRGKLADVTAEAGLASVRDVWEPFWADVDNDGDLDLYLVRPGFVGQGRNQLFRNDGHGVFHDVTRAAGLEGTRSTVRACFLDADGDGKLDLVEVGAADGNAPGVRLFHNTGARFISPEGNAGLEGTETAVDCAVGDYNADRKPDLAILAWRKPVRLYANRGSHFVDSTSDAGLAGMRTRGYSLLLFDYDKDGFLDLFVADQAPLEDVARSHLDPGFRPKDHTPQLFRNSGTGKFQEVTGALGHSRSYGTMQAVAADLDRDGWTDLVLANGSADAQRMETSVILRNVDGKSFKEWARFPDLSTPRNFIGVSAGDLNEDGQPELYFAANPLLRRQNPSGVYLNTLGGKRARATTQ